MRKLVAVALVAAGALGLGACQLNANVSGFTQGSGPGGSDLAGHTITNGATTIDEYALSGSENSVTAYANPNVDGGEREAIWFTNTPVAQDEEACATWNDSPGITQDGVMLHVTQDSGGIIHGLAVADNIWGGGGKWIINVYGVTGDPDNAIIGIQNGFTFPSVLGTSLFTMPPYPWHMCARTVGDQVQFVVWTGTNPEPAYGDPNASGEVTIPSDYQQPGIAGWWLGHIPAGSTHTISNLTTWDDDNPPPTTTTAPPPPTSEAPTTTTAPEPTTATTLTPSTITTVALP